MNLYRGTQKHPRFFVENLQKKLEELEALAGASPEKESIPDFLRRVGADNAVELHNLRGIGGAQFFTENETIAREFAGDKGFVITMVVPDEVAWAHYQGEATMTPAKEQRYSSNYVFSGKEIHDHLAEWNVDVIEMERENIELSGEAERNPAASEFRPRLR